MELGKKLLEILQDKYIVPLYQRNFAWREDEIWLLLQDIYGSFKNNPHGNYYIGSLVVLQRKNGDFEVIDGQQRLTTITLIAKILDNNINKSKLFYDSRPEVEAFFNSYYNQPDKTLFNPKVSHLINAIGFINDAILNPNENTDIKLTSLSDADKTHFKDFFFNHVFLVRVEIPEDTDVANYFEIMNNRGQQLQMHEIIKAQLLNKIRDTNSDYDRKKQKECAKIWDACSQMNNHIQKLFKKEDIKSYFGGNYDSIKYEDIKAKIESSTGSAENENADTLDSILFDPDVANGNLSTNNSNDDVDDEGTYKSIIDFPNFLMHIFKLLYNDKYQNATKTSQDQNGIDIPLNEKDLLLVFNKIENDIDSVEFIGKLLYYRAIFDRFIVKEPKAEESNDKYKWTLQKPSKSEHEDSLIYSNTFVKQDKIIKSLSMFAGFGEKQKI
jgi:uncharacterized protein with ParB-like and HNH nuclease domain